MPQKNHIDTGQMIRPARKSFGESSRKEHHFCVQFPERPIDLLDLRPARLLKSADPHVPESALRGRMSNHTDQQLRSTEIKTPHFQEGLRRCFRKRAEKRAEMNRLRKMKKPPQTELRQLGQGNLLFQLSTSRSNESFFQAGAQGPRKVIRTTQSQNSKKRGGFSSVTLHIAKHRQRSPGGDFSHPVPIRERGEMLPLCVKMRKK